jgi:hypothetical protein
MQRPQYYDLDTGDLIQTSWAAEGPTTLLTMPAAGGEDDEEEEGGGGGEGSGGAEGGQWRQHGGKRKAGGGQGTSPLARTAKKQKAAEAAKWKQQATEALKELGEAWEELDDAYEELGEAREERDDACEELGKASEERDDARKELSTALLKMHRLDQLSQRMINTQRKELDALRKELEQQHPD